MSKIAFIFPGQGSQKVGMGLDLYEKFPTAKKVLDEADQVLGFSLTELCFRGPEADLTQTHNTQPALLATSIAALRLLEEAGIKADMAAGHSLGEYSALVSAGVFSFADGLRTVRKRGLFMQEAAANRPGAMAAIFMLEASVLENICKEASSAGVVNVANYNSPEQIVISGEKAAVEKASQLATEAKAKRVIPLPVSGPFHSALMEGAAQKLAEELQNLSFNRGSFPVVTNVDATLTHEGDAFRQKLVTQVAGSVRWTQSVERMIQEGVDTFVEVGSGKVLSGLVRKINRDVKVYNVEDSASLEATLAALKS